MGSRTEVRFTAPPSYRTGTTSLLSRYNLSGSNLTLVWVQLDWVQLDWVQLVKVQLVRVQLVWVQLHSTLNATHFPSFTLSLTHSESVAKVAEYFYIVLRKCFWPRISLNFQKE